MIQGVEVNIDKKAVQEYVKAQIDDSIRSQLWFVTVDDIAELTRIGKRCLEDDVLSDPRMKMLERRKSRKRWWPAKEAYQAIYEITAEW
ncbi:hypothetical protein ACTHOQ_09380 [Solibacillus silvestris]|uniref:hypothetical protein n=1 Tax=Solibacillus silvestris TaxID=76853 RepID=UPI003F80E0C6